ncbi:MAG: hypothetical protein MZV64_32945 [Ignavibacteriales bacterium]|nr:hypothetical protein [Ignavibacteriales bacterium]
MNRTLGRERVIAAQMNCRTANSQRGTGTPPTSRSRSPPDDDWDHSRPDGWSGPTGCSGSKRTSAESMKVRCPPRCNGGWAGACSSLPERSSG